MTTQPNPSKVREALSELLLALRHKERVIAAAPDKTSLERTEAVIAYYAKVEKAESVLAALDSPAADDEKPPAIRWLIESTGWRGHAAGLWLLPPKPGDLMRWTNDANNAKWFHTKHEAEVFAQARINENNYVVTEHKFLDATPQPAPDAEAYLQDIVGILMAMDKDDRENVARGVNHQWRACIETGKAAVLGLRAYAAASARGAVGEWQDIASAPKDGTEFVVCYLGHYAVVRWMTHNGEYEKDTNKHWRSDDLYTAHGMRVASEGELRAFKWQPLPTAPIPKREGGT